MTERNQQILDFLRQTGWSAAERAALAGDASFRRYERLRRGGETAMLMDAPPPEENVRPFVAVADYLCGLGYSAPKILAADQPNGFLLLEDLGDDRFSRVLSARPGQEQTLYENAVDFLIDLHRQNTRNSLPAEGKTHTLPHYDAALLAREAALFTDWYLPQMDVEAGAVDRDAFLSLWQPFLQAVQTDTPGIVLRDYHADNLMWLPDRSGLKRIGLLDFQDAVTGHPAYDLVSLLQDARRDVPLELEEKMIARYLAASTMEEQAFRKAYAILGAQRNTKIIGIFTRLWQRDRKPVYLPLIPRVWGLLERDLAHPALQPLKNYFDDLVPADSRNRIFRDGSHGATA